MLECLYFAAIHRGHRSEHVIAFLLLSLHNTHFPICAMLTNGALTKFRIQLYVEDMMLHDRYQVFTKYDLLSNISRIWLPHTPQPIRPLPWKKFILDTEMPVVSQVHSRAHSHAECKTIWYWWRKHHFFTTKSCKEKVTATAFCWWWVYNSIIFGSVPQQSYSFGDNVLFSWLPIYWRAHLHGSGV